MNDVPRQYRALYKRGVSGRSRKAAIRAHCLECVAWVPSEVVKCTALGCVLYPYRHPRGMKDE